MNVATAVAADTRGDAQWWPTVCWPAKARCTTIGPRTRPHQTGESGSEGGSEGGSGGSLGEGHRGDCDIFHTQV